MKNGFNRIIKKIYFKIYKKSPTLIKRRLNSIIRIWLKMRKLSFEIHLTEHCNLNCKGCDNFSPVANKEFINLDFFENEMTQMCKIFGKKGIEEIRLLGGEPLLHPEIKKILKISRRIFPETRLTIISNGLLLPKMDMEFFDICKSDNIQILVTKYPVNFDYDKVLDNIRKDGVNCGAFNEEPIKTLFKKILDFEGKQDVCKSNKLCMNANHCISLKDGKLYTCSTIPNVKHLNSFFGVNFLVDEDKDCIDIFKITDAKKIRRLLNRPVPFCRYCDIEHEEFGIKFETSKKVISEWT